MANFGDARVPDYIWQRIQTTDSGCWRWTGYLSTGGYSSIWLRRELQSRIRARRNVSGHRLFYLLFVGPLEPGADRQIDHLCRNRACVNPDHLEYVTAHENARRASRAQKAACVRGHSLTDPDNVTIRIRNGHPNRRCVTCRREQAAIDNVRARERAMLASAMSRPDLRRV